MEITIKIVKLATYKIICGEFSLRIDEANYIKNGWYSNNMRQGGINETPIFNDVLLDQLDSLILSISVWFDG